MTKYHKVNLPPWLINPELIAPCPCGVAFDPEIPVAVATESRTGLRRWWHAPCWYAWVNDGTWVLDEDDYDEE